MGVIYHVPSYSRDRQSCLINTQWTQRRKRNVINYAHTPSRQMLTITPARGRHKTKRNVFSNAYILNHTVSPYSLYVSVVPINKGLHNFHSVFTRQQ